MKLSWKIFLSTLIIMVSTFSIGGYLLISVAFHSAFNRESGAALEENKMLHSYFGALISTISSEDQVDQAMTNISDSIITYFTKDKLAIRICNKDREIIAQSEDVNFDECLLQELLLQELKDNSLIYKPGKYNDQYYIQTASVLQTLDDKVYIETIHDISSIFIDRQNLFSFYRKLIFCILVINGFFVFLMTVWTISPLKKLSNTTKEIAAGKYNNRVVVQSKDEIGLLAEDFNKMADSLETKIRDLEATAISQRDFIGSFAHEIKTPLTSIIGYADMLRSKQMSEVNRVLAADYIFDEGKRLETISHKLLNLLVVQNYDFEMRQIRIKELFNEVEGVMRPTLIDRNIVLQIFTDDIQVRVEPDLMKTLIINLLDNARKAISKNGKISLLAKRLSVDRFVIVVEDNGKGIPKEELSRITEIFYMVDKSRLKDGGVGIGLALCKEIVEIHDGEMKFESQVGNGTRVYLDLRG